MNDSRPVRSLTSFSKRKSKETQCRKPHDNAGESGSGRMGRNGTERITIILNVDAKQLSLGQILLC